MQDEGDHESRKGAKNCVNEEIVRKDGYRRAMLLQGRSACGILCVQFRFQLHRTRSNVDLLDQEIYLAGLGRWRRREKVNV